MRLASEFPARISHRRNRNFVLLSFGPRAWSQSNNTAQAQIATVHVDVEPAHEINAFDPDSALEARLTSCRAWTSIKFILRTSCRNRFRPAGGPSLTAITPSCAWRRGTGRKTARGAMRITERLLHRQHGAERSDSLHPGVRAAASRIRDRR